MAHRRKKKMHWAFVKCKLHQNASAESVRPQFLWSKLLFLHPYVFLCAPVLSHVVTQSDWNISSSFSISMCLRGLRLAPKHCTLHKVTSGWLTSLLLFPGCQNKSLAAERVQQETASWAQGVSRLLTWPLQRSYSKSFLMGSRRRGRATSRSTKACRPPSFASNTHWYAHTHVHTHTHCFPPRCLLLE